MKKLSTIFTMCIMAFVLNNVSINAQAIKTGEKYFIGKWNVMVYGLPDGDTKMVINIEKKDDKITGNMADPAKTDTPLELTNIEVADSTFKATFSAQGMDIALTLKIKDDKNIAGNMMDMFEIKGTKEN